MKLDEGLYAYRKPGMGQNGSHTYVVRGGMTLMVDPGFERNFRDLVLSEMIDDGLDPNEVDVIANTHLHRDHSEGNGLAAEKADADIALHQTQMEFVNSDTSSQSAFHLPKVVDFTYGEVIDLKGVELRAVETPGHAPGHVSFYWDEKKVLLCGDSVFKRNVGRVDLPGGDDDAARRSVERIQEMDIEMLLPAHGELMTDKEEVKDNLEFILEKWYSLE